MSQSSVLDRETVVEVEPRTDAALPGAPLLASLPTARTRRDHLTLVDGNLSARHLISAPQPLRPVRRPWFGLYEASLVLLMLGAGGTALYELMRLG